MLNYLLLYRSLTQTQMAAGTLDRAGIANRIIRAPAAITTEGCGHCIRLGQGSLHRAVTVLNARGIPPRRIYVTAGNDNYEEVLL